MSWAAASFVKSFFFPAGVQCVSLALHVFLSWMDQHAELLKTDCWYLCRVALTAHDSWRNCAFFMPVSTRLRRGAVEPVVVWCGEDDNHQGRLNNSDQHCDHPSLGMEQLHLRRWPQTEVPLLHGAEEHLRLSEVRRWTHLALPPPGGRVVLLHICKVYVGNDSDVNTQQWFKDPVKRHIHIVTNVGFYYTRKI